MSDFGTYPNPAELRHLYIVMQFVHRHGHVLLPRCLVSAGQVLIRVDERVPELKRNTAFQSSTIYTRFYNRDSRLKCITSLFAVVQWISIISANDPKTPSPLQDAPYITHRIE